MGDWVWIEGLHELTGEWTGLFNFAPHEIIRARSTLTKLLDLDDDQLLARHGLRGYEDFRLVNPPGGPSDPPDGSQSAENPDRASAVPSNGSGASQAPQRARKVRCSAVLDGHRCIKKLDPETKTHLDRHRDLAGNRW